MEIRLAEHLFGCEVVLTQSRQIICVGPWRRPFGVLSPGWVRHCLRWAMFSKDRQSLFTVLLDSVRLYLY